MVRVEAAVLPALSAADVVDGVGRGDGRVDDNVAHELSVRCLRSPT